MFDLTFVDGGRASRRPWTFTASLICQGIVISTLALASVAAGPGLPLHDWTAVFLAPPKPPAAKAPPKQQPVQTVAPERFQSELTQPRSIPDRVAMIVEEAPPAEAAGASVEGATGEPGGGDDVITGIVNSIPDVAPPPPPPPVVEKTKPEPETSSSIVVGGDVQAAKLLRKVAPAYPVLARQARIQGVVKLQAIIAEDGSIDELRVLSGHPLLIPSAIQAVKQWRYRPTLLNNKPVRVVTQVDVRFQLN
ncbi:MAG: TonB family protein [Acidobacteria bacterium]|nr:TonB family protein [Acidobacteriota bacterium]